MAMKTSLLELHSDKLSNRDRNPLEEELNSFSNMKFPKTSSTSENKEEENRNLAKKRFPALTLVTEILNQNSLEFCPCCDRPEG